MGRSGTGNGRARWTRAMAQPLALPSRFNIEPALARSKLTPLLEVCPP